MSQKVIINIKSRQDIAGGSVDKIEYEFKGVVHKKRGIYYLVYNDYSEGMSGARTTLKIEPKAERIFLRRDKPVALKQIFQPGEKKEGVYQTAAGKLEMEIKTESIKIEVNNKMGEIIILYCLYFNNIFTTENKLEIYFEKGD